MPGNNTTLEGRIESGSKGDCLSAQATEDIETATTSKQVAQDRM